MVEKQQEMIRRVMKSHELTEGQWLENRSKGLGATDVAALSGVHPYETPSSVYAKKRGLIETEFNDAMWWGKKEEPIILERWELETKMPIERVGYRNFSHPEYPWAMCTPDAFFADYTAGVEAKSVGVSQRKRWGEEWTDKVPEEYYIQCQWNMFVTGLDVWYLSVKMDRTLHKFQIPRREDIIKAMFDRANIFWHKNIIGGVIPEPDSSEQYKALITIVNSDDVEDEYVEADDEMWKLLADLKKAKEDLEEVTNRKQYIENVIMKKIGKKKGVWFNDKIGRITWTLPSKRKKNDYQNMIKELEVEIMSRYPEATEMVQGIKNKYTQEVDSPRTFRTNGIKFEEVEFDGTE